MSQSIQASTSSSTGDPDPADVHLSSANLSPPLTANVRHTASWCEPRMLTQKAPDSCIRGQELDVRSGKNATSGGSSDTDVNEPTAIPAGVPSLAIPVTTATPVGKCPSTCRNRLPSNVTIGRYRPLTVSSD